MDLRRPFLLILLLSGYIVLSQDLTEFNRDRLNINEKGMLVLGTWAVGNILVGGIQSFRTEGETRAFHQMNAGWNVVNLAIAGFGYYSALKGEMDLSMAGTLEEQFKMEKILLFNAGLDLGYIGLGAYLNERGKRDVNRAEQLRGFGKSIMMQGAFLFVFDITMAWIHRAHYRNELLPFLGDAKWSLSPSGFSFLLEF